MAPHLLLACPHCRGPLRRRGPAWRCEAGHAFDVARQGYVNLTVGRPRHRGDTPDMLDARAAVLGSGHLEAVTRALLEACEDLPSGALVEAGAGTAHHLAAVRRRLGARHGVAMDASVAAARRAARADPGWITAVVADVWEPWPLLDGIAAAVLSVFAPRNLPETARVLASSGLLVAATPADDHLAELVEALGLLAVPPRKAGQLVEEAGDLLEAVSIAEVRDRRRLDRDAVRALAAMGPSAHHISSADLEARLAVLPPTLDVTVAVHVTRLRKPAG